MKLPNYLVPEIMRRLERDMRTAELTKVLAPLGLDLDEPGPPPPTKDMEERYDDPCDAGSFVLEGELAFLGHTVPVHFRVSYAGHLTTEDPFEAILGGPTMSLDLLTWDEGDPACPSWTPVGPGILSNKMMDAIWAGISWHATQPENCKQK